MHNSLYKVITSLSIMFLFLSSAQLSRAQLDQNQADAQAACDEQHALLLIHHQIEAIKSLEVTAASIEIMTRAADLLWLRQTDTARAIFTRAYEMAEKEFQEKGDIVIREGRLLIELPDQRFAVMQAIARHDPEWARRLAERAAEETRRQAEKARAEAENSVAPNTQADSLRNVGDKMLVLASSLITIDEKAAIRLAGNALASASGYSALNFLFKLVESNPTAADQLCRRALNSYASGSLEGLLYMAAYVFLIDHNIGPSGVTRISPVPQTLSPNSVLQQLFLEMMFRRAEQSLRPLNESTSQTGPDLRFPEAAELYLALEKLSPHIARYQPAYSERAIMIKNILRTALSSDIRQQAEATLRQREEDGGNRVERLLERADRENDLERRDQHLALAAIEAINTESAERAIDVAKRVKDEKVRSQLLNYIYFKQAQKAIERGNLDEARRLALNVELLDQRAYLYYEIAAQALKRLEDRVLAREALDEVALAASRAPNTNEKARTLLGIAHLYAKFDSIRAFEIMSEAVKTINHIENPDISSNMIQRIEGTTFSYYTSHTVEGFSLETSFRELAPFDFIGALLIAQGLENRPIRATAILALAASCLESAEKVKKNLDQK